MEKHINKTKIMKRENSTNLWTEWAAANSTLALLLSVFKLSFSILLNLVFQLNICVATTPICKPLAATLLSENRY